MRYDVVLEGRILDDDASVPPEEFIAWTHAITVELMKLRAITPTIGGSAEDSTVEIRVVVEAEDPDLAVGIGGTQIRTAAHAAGLATPDWTVRWLTAYGKPGLDGDVPEDARPFEVSLA